MVHYISKDALVAEIKWRIDGCYKMCAGNLDFLKKAYPEHYYSIETYKEILSFINSLEMKDVDLEEKACDAYCKVCGHYAHTTPNHICRQACDYYKNFVKYMKRK
jgi:hypothetical protein